MQKPPRTLDQAVTDLAAEVLAQERRLATIGAALPKADQTAIKWKIRGLRDALAIVAGRPAEDVLTELGL